MPRILPWKRREHQVFAPRDSPRSSSSPVPRVKQEDAAHDRDSEHSPSPSNIAVTTKKTPKRPYRSTSTSPPLEPPQETFMIEGTDGDDRYRMVEDEFLATAHQFTAHLHAAEYKRLKANSELENAQTIKNISRPVVGQMTDMVKMKQERKTLAEKQRIAARKLRKGEGSGDESTEDDDKNDSWQKQSLYGLMESPGKRAKGLNGLPSATLVTRAAAGFNKQSTVVSPTQPKSKPMDISSPTRHHKNSSDNGLESSSSYRIAHRSPRPVPTTSRMVAPRRPEAKKFQAGSSYKTTEDTRSGKTKAAETTVISEDEDLDIMTRLKKRQEERKRNRQQRRSTHNEVKSNLDDIIPGFL
ncbi:hypothetical protein F5B22DRAFT_581444 [Xylaria bambusicola]|uniref:uncharacterized protein n=1 Tax=Xylaria bambusicola TaxID=326684 RepID=UPI0020082D11|nr:uncharacterized protein F5B22DRAFT_581444 [Xylaria bambusicola]KAI0502907.1 hypothetical protein F5B22DRAFT_581444 [Xylaria bambusicola]